jgi:hypothetical protein
MRATHLCRRCEEPRRVDRAETTRISDVVPQYIWARWDRCQHCGDTGQPLEILDANHPEAGR